MDTPVTLVTTKPDAERAKDIRAKIEEALGPVCCVMDEAVAAGFTIGFQLAPDYRQRHVIALLKVTKDF